MVGQQKTTKVKVVVGKLVKTKMIKLKSILNEKLNNNQYQMVDGIIDILIQVKDMENRKEIADNMIQQFKDENIVFDYDKFYKAIGCK
jgi:N-acetylmuramic acid 6-phosphate (MurNAc-6-P) etherase